MDRQRLAEIRERWAKATMGPWEVGVEYVDAAVNDGSHRDWSPPSYIPPGQCAMCDAEGQSLAKAYTDQNGGTVHRHRLPRSDSWREIHAVSGDLIIGNYDCDQVGIASSPEDAAFIAHAWADIHDLLAALDVESDAPLGN